MTDTRLLIVRHGETPWSRRRRHTGRTDVPLDPDGEDQARALPGALPLHDIFEIWCSPLQRATETARLAGLHIDRIEPDLIEWDYGTAEGRTTAEIREEIPGWDVWTHGVQDGESANEVGARADRVLAEARGLTGTILLMAHAHLLRILTARWLGQPATFGSHLTLDPAGWALLGWERETAVIERWNPPAL